MPGFATDRDGLKYPEWQSVLREAVLELDQGKLKARVAAAEMAIINRQRAMSENPDHRAERQAIEDAWAILRVLKRDVLHVPEQELISDEGC